MWLKAEVCSLRTSVFLKLFLIGHQIVINEIAAYIEVGTFMRTELLFAGSEKLIRDKIILACVVIDFEGCEFNIYPFINYLRLVSSKCVEVVEYVNLEIYDIFSIIF